MRRVFALSCRYFRQRPARVVLTSLATAAAATLVVWVVSGYDALLGTFDTYSNLALGRYPLSVAPISSFSQYAPGAIPSPAEKQVPPDVIELLRGDPAVAAADPMWVLGTPVRPFTEEGQEPIPWRRLPDARLVGTDAPEPPFALVKGRWIDPRRPDLMEAVLSEHAASGMNLDLGGHVVVGLAGRVHKLRVVGIVGGVSVEGWSAAVASSQLRTPAIGGLYVPMALAEKLSDETARASFVGVSLRDEADLTAFRFRLAPRLSQSATPCQFQEAHDIEEALDESASAENLRLQAQAATLVSMLAALFIIFSTLNMGVSERVRQLAILRAVAFTRLEVGCLVVFEGLLFGTIGFIVGCGAGKLLLVWAVRSAPDLLEDGAVVGTNSLLLAAACAYGGALLASLVPALRAMRVRPVDVMRPPAFPSRRLLSSRAIAGGLLLVLAYPLLAHGWPWGDGAPFVAFLFLGLGCLAAGFTLLAPAFVLAMDRVGSPVLARLLRVPPRLLASQISGNLGRTVSTALALTVGLGFFVGIQVWGATMLGGFMPGAWAPDALISFRPHGIGLEWAERVARFEGVKKALPIVVEQPRLKEDLTRSAIRATVVRQDNVVMVGIDPRQAFSGKEPLFSFEWAAGDPGAAIAGLQEGRACLVPDHFLREARLKVGDSFELVPPENPGQPVRYTIAGAVRLPGWHWQTKPTGLRTRTHRAAALVFAAYDQVAQDFGFQGASQVWLDFDSERTSPEALSAAAQTLYREALGREAAIGEARNDEPSVEVVTVGHIREIVRAHARQWLWALSRLPLVVLVITSLGVLNALLASVQSRRWEIGVLRSIGISRGTVIRLVIAEGILIGLVACAISLAFGILAGWCGAGISRYLSFFGGMPLELAIPWPRVGFGFALVILLSSLASLWPAFSIGRREPLELLQEGRGAF